MGARPQLDRLSAPAIFSAGQAAKNPLARRHSSPRTIEPPLLLPDRLRILMQALAQFHTLNHLMAAQLELHRGKRLVVIPQHGLKPALITGFRHKGLR
jgi:hypothetical protein